MSAEFVPHTQDGKRPGLESAEPTLSAQGDQTRLRGEQLTDRVAEIFREIGCGSQPCIRTDLAATPHLSEQRIAMIDDSNLVLASFIPALVSAANGNVTAIRFDGALSTEQMTGKLQAFNPSVILVDYFLTEHVVGTNLIPALRVNFPEAILIGFSSNWSVELISAFIGAGADRFVQKCTARDTIEKLDCAVAQIMDERRVRRY